MAFIDIEDPIRREAIVQDYIKNIKEIRARRENEKVRGVSQRQDLARVFQPVVDATEKSASQITNELRNLKEESKQEEPKYTNKAVEYYLEQFSKSKLDQYFGIYKENGVYMMGNKEVVIDAQNNIRIDNGADAFKGTQALWRLIMYKTPEIYDDNDFENYSRLLEKTNAIDMPHKTAGGDRPKNTSKWKFFKETGLVGGAEEEADEDYEKKPEIGSGIQFLPSDINALIAKLHLLLAESRAGNKSSTRNQIVAILDELRRRNYLSQEEYNGACEQLSC